MQRLDLQPLLAVFCFNTQTTSSSLLITKWSGKKVHCSFENTSFWILMHRDAEKGRTQVQTSKMHTIRWNRGKNRRHTWHNKTFEVIYTSQILFEMANFTSWVSSWINRCVVRRRGWNDYPLNQEWGEEITSEILSSFSVDKGYCLQKTGSLVLNWAW